jgi:hypothetical protein
MGFFAEDELTYKGIIATLGMRLNGWAPGKFADDAIANPDAPVVEQIREDYLNKTLQLGGLRWKARLLPRINVSFPVTANNVLYFNYGHSMRLPHPRFSYAGLDPVYQDRSFLSFLGNPDLDPEVNVSYEVGYKAALNKSLGITLSAYNNNRFDYIVSRRVLVKDQTGRLVAKTMYINQDYAWGQDSKKDFAGSMSKLFPNAKAGEDQLPKFGAGQYGTEISALMSKPADVTHSSLWGGDLQALILQAGPRGLFKRTQMLLSAGDHVLPGLGDKMPDGVILGARGAYGHMSPKSALNDWWWDLYSKAYNVYPVQAHTAWCKACWA